MKQHRPSLPRIIIALVLAWFVEPNALSGDDTTVLSENFDELKSGMAIDGVPSWEAFRGFNGEPPTAVVRDAAGRKSSRALAVSHTSEFRSDGWGLNRRLDKPLGDGIVWLECYFHPPQQWTGSVYFDARAGRAVVARIGGGRYEHDDLPEPVLRVHASWTHSYWRMYRNVSLKDDWYRLTMRLDLDGGTYAAWIDDYVLGEELPLCSAEPIDHVYLGCGGTPDDPARIDDLCVSRQAPADRPLRRLLPKPGEKLAWLVRV